MTIAWSYTEDPEPLHSINGDTKAGIDKKKKRRLIALSLTGLVLLVSAVILTVTLVLVYANKDHPGEAINAVVNNIVVKDPTTGETVAQLNSTTLGTELWQPLAQAFGLSQLVIKNPNITECACTNGNSTTTNSNVTTTASRASADGIRISKETNKVIITGSIDRILGMVEAQVTLVILIPTSTSTSTSELVPQLVLQIFTSLDWNPTDLPFFQPSSSSSSSTPWITGISFTASGSLVVASTSFSQFTIQDSITNNNVTTTTTSTTTTALVRGLNLFFHNVRLNFQTSTNNASSTIADALESIPLGDISIRDLDIDFTATIENTQTTNTNNNDYKDDNLLNGLALKATLMLSASIQLGEVLSPINTYLELTLLQNGVNSAPVLGLTTDLKMDLRPLNPDIDLHVRGDFVTSLSQNAGLSFQMVGVITTSEWSRPFGLDWLSFGDIVVTLSMDKDGLNECTFRTSASVTFPTVNNKGNVTQTIEFYGILTGDKELVFTTSLANGEQLNLASLPRLIASLLNLDYESIAPVINGALNVAENVKIAFAISTTEGNFNLPTGLVNSSNTHIPLQLGKGITIMTSVDAGEVIEDIAGVFFKEIDVPQLEFRAGIVIPIFDVISDVTSFKQNFEAFLSTPDIKINDQFTFLGFDVITRPFAPSFLISGSGNVTLDATDSLICYVSGELSPTAGVTLGGSVVGTWRRVFGINGLNVGNVSLEISFVPGASITGFGMAASFDIGTVEADLQLAVSVTDFTSFYLYANVDNLSVKDIIVFLELLNEGRTNNFINPDEESFAEQVNFENIQLYIAPSDGELQGIRYEKGFGFAAEVKVFLFTVAAGVKLIQDREVGPLVFDDVRIFFKLTFIPIEDVVEKFLEFLFPGVDIPDLSIDLGPIGTLSLSDIFSIQSVELEEFSLYDIFHGELPVFTLVVKIVGIERTFSTDMPFDAFVQSMDSVLEQSDLPDYVAKCISNAQCTNAPNYKCDHTQQPWVCVESCPSSTTEIADMGCFVQGEFNHTNTNTAAKAISASADSTTTTATHRTATRLAHVRRREIDHSTVRYRFREITTVS
eukprot:TRINITY_DN4897_c0_g1_i1.p1 TRINITY_DN4897_c0_g1~~TRINITY_DN4897_c0_g1_i1.p1  ORF type:complete len:1065 (+),score=272.02 TRINITY_DN4897_c0_g1_i1:136-3330(+)